MNTENYFKTTIIKNALIIFLALIIPLYFYLSFVNHLLFHTIVAFSIMTLGVIGPTVGIITSLRMKNNILSKLSPAMFIYTMLLFVHLISYRGMSLTLGVSDSFASQIWLGANASLAVGCLATTIDFKRKISVITRLILTTLVACVIFSMSFYNLLPATSIAGEVTVFSRAYQSFIILYSYYCFLVL